MTIKNLKLVAWGTEVCYVLFISCESDWQFISFLDFPEIKITLWSTYFVRVTSKYLIPASQETYIIKPNRLLLSREIIHVILKVIGPNSFMYLMHTYFDCRHCRLCIINVNKNHRKFLDTMREKCRVLFNTNSCGTYSSHYNLKG
jgi:hypothetical protein